MQLTIVLGSVYCVFAFRVEMETARLVFLPLVARGCYVDIADRVSSVAGLKNLKIWGFSLFHKKKKFK